MYLLKVMIFHGYVKKPKGKLFILDHLGVSCQGFERGCDDLSMQKKSGKSSLAIQNPCISRMICMPKMRRRKKKPVRLIDPWIGKRAFNQPVAAGITVRWQLVRLNLILSIFLESRGVTISKHRSSLLRCASPALHGIKTMVTYPVKKLGIYWGFLKWGYRWVPQNGLFISWKIMFKKNGWFGGNPHVRKLPHISYIPKSCCESCCIPLPFGVVGPAKLRPAPTLCHSMTLLVANCRSLKSEDRAWVVVCWRLYTYFFSQNSQDIKLFPSIHLHGWSPKEGSWSISLRSLFGATLGGDGAVISWTSELLSSGKQT